MGGTNREELSVPVSEDWPHRPARRLLARAICTFAENDRRRLYATHLSLAGACILSLRRVELDTELSIVFYPSGQEPLPPIRSRVIGALIDPANAERSGFEVVFTEADDATLDVLSRAIEELQRRATQRQAERPCTIRPARIEQRREPRVNTDLRAAMTEPPSSAALRMLNLSMSGALFACETWSALAGVEPGTKVQLTLFAYQAPEAINVRADVVRCVKHGRSGGFAVRFMDLDELTSQRLEGLLVDSIADEKDR